MVVCDYEDINYPIPFQKLVTERSNHYVYTTGDTSVFPSFVLTRDIPQFSNHSSDLLIIVGSEDQQFQHTINVLYEILLADPYASILFVDFGLSSHQFKELSHHFKRIHSIQFKMKSNGFIAYRQLNLSIFPQWMLKEIPNLSLKSILLDDVFWEWQGIVCWIDSEYSISGKLSQALTMVHHYGVYSSCTDENVSEKPCNSIIGFLMKSHSLSSHIIQSNICMGKLIMLDFDRKESHSFLSTFSRCGYTEKCIAPRDCIYQNGIALSLLLYANGIPTRPSKLPPPPQQQPSVERIMKQIHENYHVTL